MLTPDINLLWPRGRSISTSSGSQLGRTRAPSACGSQAMGNITRARSPLGMFSVDSMSLSHSLTAVGNSVTHSAVPRSPSSSDSINEPITAGIRRQRTDSAADQDDPTILTPSHTKRLKVYAKKVAEESDISEKDLYDFIDVSCCIA